MTTGNDETNQNSYSNSFLEWNGRAILLLDLDAFFASVEQLDHPEWKGLPVIVGGDADRHGVVSTCSYEARKFGVRSAMPASTARRLCPNAIWVGGNYARYREMSAQVMSIIESETPYVQQVSIDEAFADITPTRTNRENPVEVVKRIQQNVNELGITCSIGLGTTKSVAKIASDFDKPNGLTIVYPGCERQFLANLPIQVVSGIGKRSQESLKEQGINTLDDIVNASESILERVFGKNAEMMRARAIGKDESSIVMHRPVKSVSHEMTFANPLDNEEELLTSIESLLPNVGRRLRRKNLKATTLTLKIRLEDRSVRSAQVQLEHPSNDEIEFSSYIPELLSKVWSSWEKVLLVGIRASGFSDVYYQDSLIPEDPAQGASESSPLQSKNQESRSKLLSATDAIKDKFGESGVVFGSEFKTTGKGTGSSTRNIQGRDDLK